MYASLKRLHILKLVCTSLPKVQKESDERRVRGERAVHVLYRYVAYVPGGGAAPRGMLMQHIVLGLFGTVHGRPPQPTATLYHEGRNVTVLYSTVTVLRCIAESYILV